MQNSTPEVEWRVMATCGPTQTHHVICYLGDRLYSHGGVADSRSDTPTSDFFVLHSGIWNKIRAEGSPRLSHHSGLTIADRYLLLTGGWNGHSRSSRLYVYDSCENKWTEVQCKGWPRNKNGDTVGLSSHTSTLLSCQPNHNTCQILLLGRDGRRKKGIGTAYLLTGSVIKGFRLIELNSDGFSARSGHSTMALNQGRLLCIGGRNDGIAEVLKSDFSTQGSRLSFVADLKRKCYATTENRVNGDPVTSRRPLPRSHHVSLSHGPFIYVHGGMSFRDQGTKEEVLGDQHLGVVSRKGEIEWTRLSDTSVRRLGHATAIHAKSGRCVLHGGRDQTHAIRGDCYTIDVFR